MPTQIAADELRRQASELLAQADALESKHCTGLTASWCPRHGDCRCPAREDALDDPNCPLHSPDSTHAVGTRSAG